MRIKNKKINNAIKKIKEYYGESFDFRDDNERPDLSTKKYHLYQLTQNGFQCRMIIKSFKTQKEFVNWVDNLK